MGKHACGRIGVTLMGRKPSRGEIWMADFEPVTGHEQGGKRPCLVLSDNLFNHGPAKLVVVLPITSKNREVPLRVPIAPPEGGLNVVSYIMPEMIRSISVERLIRCMGTAGPPQMELVEAHVCAVLGLG